MLRFCFGCICLVIGSLVFSPLALAEENEIYEKCKTTPAVPGAIRRLLNNSMNRFFAKTFLNTGPKPMEYTHGVIIS